MVKRLSPLELRLHRHLKGVKWVVARGIKGYVRGVNGYEVISYWPMSVPRLLCV